MDVDQSSEELWFAACEMNADEFALFRADHEVVRLEFQIRVDGWGVAACLLLERDSAGQLALVHEFNEFAMLTGDSDESKI